MLFDALIGSLRDIHANRNSLQGGAFVAFWAGRHVAWGLIVGLANGIGLHGSRWDLYRSGSRLGLSFLLVHLQLWGWAVDTRGLGIFWLGRIFAKEASYSPTVIMTMEGFPQLYRMLIPYCLSA